MSPTHEIGAVHDAPSVDRDEQEAETEFLVGALGNIDAELLASGYDQLRLGQAHVSRALDLIRLTVCKSTARYLMLSNARLMLEQARAI